MFLGVSLSAPGPRPLVSLSLSGDRLNRPRAGGFVFGITRSAQRRPLMMKKTHQQPSRAISIALLMLLSSVSARCVGSPVHSTIKYNAVQNTIKRHNQNLLKLKIGMSQDEVLAVMGDPERSEGYSWGSAWLYRTAMTSGIYGTADSDFTPVVFDNDASLVGWGRRNLHC